MKISRSTYSYRIDDLVRNAWGGEFRIIDITETDRFGISYCYYRIKNTSKGCLDSPIWISETLLYGNYEPCSEAIRVLFGYPQGSEATTPRSASGRSSNTEVLEASTNATKSK